MSSVIIAEVTIDEKLMRMIELYAGMRDVVIQCKFVEGLIWSGLDPDCAIPLIATIAPDTLGHFRMARNPHLEPVDYIITMHFDIMQIFAFLRFSFDVLHVPAHIIRFHIHFHWCYLDFYDHDNKRIEIHHDDGYLEKISGETVPNDTFNIVTQEHINPDRLLTLNLQTRHVRRMMIITRALQLDFGRRYDIPISFIAFNKVLGITAGARGIWIDKEIDQFEENANRFQLLSFKCNSGHCLFKAMYLAEKVCISCMPPILQLQLADHLKIIIYIGVDSVCKPEAWPR